MKFQLSNKKQSMSSQESDKQTSMMKENLALTGKLISILMTAFIFFVTFLIKHH
jgi:hypothetical protein